MFKKKLILASVTVMLTASFFTLPALAHGHHHGGGHHRDTTAGSSAVSDSANPGTGSAAIPDAYPVCTLEGCTETGHHLHDGSYYCGYHHAGGYCDGSCTVYSSSPYPVCTLEGCTETGHHLHDGSYYCGYHHAGGYCDGSCIGSSPAVDNPPAAENLPSTENLPAADSYNYGKKHGCHRSYARKLVYCH